MVTHHDWRVITLEDWALIQRLAAEGAHRGAVRDLSDDGVEGGAAGVAAAV